MQTIQVTVKDVLLQFISKTQLGSDFIQFQMKRNKASIQMIESMLKSEQIKLLKN